MDLETLMQIEWSILAPEFIILGVATLLSIIDLFLGKEKSRTPLAFIGIAGIIAAVIAIFTQLNHPVTSILNETYRLDSFSKAFKLLLLVATAFIFIVTIDYNNKKVKAYRGEFYYLLLTALLGAMFMASSADMITLFVGLELLSISSYIMAGLRKDNLASNEASFKYIINGGIHTAITLFGMSYVYGLTGSTNLYTIIEVFTTEPLIKENMFMLVLSFVMVFVGMTFKIASAPFHMWAPDVYQGAPTPVTAFLSVVSKTAGFVFILRFFLLSFFFAPGFGGEGLLVLNTQIYVAIIAGLTMIIGNVVALRQTNIKRMFAYSSVAHAGYLLIPFITLSELVFKATWFYLLAYLFMNIGVFAIIQLVSQKEGSEDLKSFTGLYRKSPLVAVLITIFILSLAGIPGTGGFVAKYGILMTALGSGEEHYVLAAVLMATTVISYFYYFNVLTQVFFRAPDSTGTIRPRLGTGIVLVLCAIGTIVLGIIPGVVFDFYGSYFNMLDMFPLNN
jgi:NADH-quinone oxidoreductase subunit N